MNRTDGSLTYERPDSFKELTGDEETAQEFEVRVGVCSTRSCMLV
jgi:hypothetical protein